MAPNTRSKNDDKGTPNDSNDGGYSYFQKTVCLHDWWLVKAEKDFEGKRLAVAGSTSRESKAVRLFTSAPIVKRYDVFTLETADGICVCFKGFIDEKRTLENGFPYEVFNHFYFGFPPYWEVYAKECLGETLTTDIELEVAPDASESTRDSDPSLISIPRKKVSIQDKHVQMSSVENASKGSDVLNHAVNLSIKVKERSNIDIGIDADHLNNVTVQTTADVDVFNASKGNSLAANLPRSTEERINQSPSNIGTDKVNVKKKKNKVNVNLHTPGKRTTRSQIQITNGSQKKSKSPEVGRSKTQKDRVSTKKVQNEQKLNLSIPSSVPSRLTPVKGRCSPRKETQRKLDFEEDVVNVRTKSNTVNVNSHTHGNRIIRSQIQITNSSQRKNPEVGFSKTQKHKTSTKKVQDEQKLNRSVPSSVPLRKLDLEEFGSSVSQKIDRKQSVFSPKSLSFKCSRSGRVLLPPLEFWRNQSPVYDQNRRITGIKEEVDAEKPSGSRSKPQKRQKL